MKMPRRHKHNLGHYNLTTGNLGTVIPLTQYDVLPGDSIQQSTSCFIRMSTLMAPVMHPVQVGIYSFYNPLRILDENFPEMITGKGATPPPTVTANSTSHTLLKAMGITPDSGETINAHHVYAYNNIINNYFIDKDIQSYVSLSNLQLKQACWNKDWFTTIRASAQQGSAVTIPLGTSANIEYNAPDNKAAFLRDASTGNLAASENFTTSGAGGQVQTATSGAVFIDPNDTLYADLANATGGTVSDFMEALAMQSYAEARNRYGEEYVDYLRYLGVNPRDSRLQRPEYLGGGRSMVQFSEVLNQSATTGDLGDMGGHGISAVKTPSFRRFFPEHGVVTTVMVVRPLHMIANALNHQYLKSTKEDYYQHELRNIGDREVLNKEVYDEHTSPDSVFGYAPRYDEYRSLPNIIANEMRDAIYDDYHMARIHTSDPAINSAFVECNPSNRSFADAGTNDNFLTLANHKIVARRIVPKYTKPLGGLL